MDAGRGMVTVVASGELDAAAAPEIAAQLAQIAAHRPQRLVFDLTGLWFLDCAAARLIAFLASERAWAAIVASGMDPVSSGEP